jgi:transcriptional regulator with XRE-family HTH domain
VKGLTKLRETMLIEEITQQELAEKTGLNRTVISQLCVGRLIPRKEERQKIAEALGKDENALFEG